MKLTFFRLICRLLIVTLTMLSYQCAQAGMIGADQVANANVASERLQVQQALQRNDVLRELESMGIDPQTARDRVANLTDDEVHTLAGKINNLPVGADSGFIALILIVFFIWYFAFRR